MKEFGKIMRTVRLSAGLSQGTVARAWDVATSRVSDVERGASKPTRAQVLWVASLPGADPEQVIAAAALDRGHFSLSTAGASPARIALGAALARRWDDLTEEECTKILEILRHSPAGNRTKM